MYKVIADRYELLDLIGQGGMADVYLAKDSILNRTIAVKILRTSLAKDPIYIARFQREASAAASLSHKNIVEIYDVGEDNNQYYIVMEYVPGQTLKELIHKRGALHYIEAIDIMKQVVSGVAKAHQLGIVHRDLKPQNILVTDSGNAKIADFGIASMQSLAQVTQTDVIMGSLHYLAPELARGEKATSQSDIYALGIVLYELLRGEVPFNGESPVNIALKHMQDDIPSLREFNPTIPQSVENIVIKATAKNLKNRYLNAIEMLEDIQSCLDRKDESKLIFETPASDPTIVADSRTLLRGQKIDDDHEEDEYEDYDEYEKESTFIDKIKALDIKIKIAIGAGITAAIALFILLMVFVFGGNSSTMLPDLKGMSVEDANILLERYDVSIDEDLIEYELSNEYEEGQIIDTDPKPGKSVKKGTKIKAIVSSGKTIIMNDYEGETEAEAKSELTELGFDVRIEREASSKEAGTVIGQSIKKGEEVDPKGNLSITLTVSKGPKIVLDNYVGRKYEDAVKELSALNFNVSKNEIESDEPAGTVIAQSKDSGTSYDPDDSLNITLTVSAGRSYQVTYVIGFGYREAESRLLNDGFQVKLKDLGMAPDSSYSVNVVVRQSPDGGTVVKKKGTTVTISYYSSVPDSNTSNED